MEINESNIYEARDFLLKMAQFAKFNKNVDLPVSVEYMNDLAEKLYVQWKELTTNKENHG